MTISSTTRKAGPFAGNNATVVFPFTFKVFDDTDMVVVATDASDVESTLTLTTHYTVSINADQDASPGGTVTCVTAPASGTLLTITSDVPDLQPVSLTNGGGFYPAVINGALDRLTIQVQQVAEATGRAVKVQISSSTRPDDLIAALTADAAAAASSAASAASSAAAAAAAIPSGSLGYTPVDVTGDTMTGPLEVPSLVVNGSSPISTIGSAATKSIGAAAGNVPLWEYIPLNGVLSKSATYSVVTGDRGKLIDFSGLSAGVDAMLPAVSDGLSYAIRNSDTTYSVTLKGAATIDGVAGATGIPIGPGESGFAVCNGTVWKTVARQRSYAIQVGTPLIQNPAVLNATTTQAHGLGSEPDYIKVVLECLTGDVEYAAGDRIVISSSLFLDGNYAAVSGITVRADATNVYMKYGPAAMYLNYKTSNSGTVTVPSSWKVICTPYKFPT